MNTKPPIAATRVNTLFAILTEDCNSHCKACTYGQKPSKRYLAIESLDAAISQLVSLGLKDVMLTGGEVFLHPELKDIIDLVTNKGLRLKVATNGILFHLLPEEYWKKVNLWVVSLDAVSGDIYQRVRRTDNFNSILASLNKLVSLGVSVRGSFLIQHENYLQTAEFLRYALLMGLSSVSILVPNWAGPFGPVFRNSYDEGVLLSSCEVDMFCRTQLPHIEGFLNENPEFTNLNEQKLQMYVEYMRAMACGLRFVKKTNGRCSFPLNSLLIAPGPSLKLCFFFNEKYVWDSTGPIDTEELKIARGMYYFQGLNNEVCSSCLQTY